MTTPFSDSLGALRFPTLIRPDQYEDGRTAYIAESPDLPGCKGHGLTPDEALVDFKKAQVDYLETLREEGIELPTPQVDSVVEARWTLVPQPGPSTVGRTQSITVPGWLVPA